MVSSNGADLSLHQLHFRTENVKTGILVLTVYLLYMNVLTNQNVVFNFSLKDTYCPNQNNFSKFIVVLEKSRPLCLCILLVGGVGFLLVGHHDSIP